MNVFDFTPPIVPGSSPFDRENSDPLMPIIIPPSAVTVVVPLSSVKAQEYEKVKSFGRIVARAEHDVYRRILQNGADAFLEQFSYRYPMRNIFNTLVLDLEYQDLVILVLT